MSDPIHTAYAEKFLDIVTSLNAQAQLDRKPRVLADGSVTRNPVCIVVVIAADGERWSTGDQKFDVERPTFRQCFDRALEIIGDGPISKGGF